MRENTDQITPNMDSFYAVTNYMFFFLYKHNSKFTQLEIRSIFEHKLRSLGQPWKVYSLCEKYYSQVTEILTVFGTLK